MTREEAIKRLETVRDQSNQAVFTITAVVRDWENYGKSRTYFKLIETSNTTKHYKDLDLGYFDNKANVYVAGQRDLEAETVYDFGGNNIVKF